MRGNRSQQPWRQLYQAGEKLCRKYEQGGNLEHLSKAIGNLWEALVLCPVNASQRMNILNWFGWALQERYDREGKLEDLTQAIQYRQEALDLCAPGHSNRAHSLNQLAVVLCTRYNREGNLEDLTHAIQYHLEALDLRRPRHPKRSTTLDNLAGALWKRYNREGDLADLVMAIQYFREALDLRGPGHPNRSTSLDNLAVALGTRYNLEGNLEDLAQAIQYHGMALELRGPGHPDRPYSLSNLASALKTRYNRKGNLEDLTLATQYYRAALDLHPPGHPGRSFSLNALSNALHLHLERLHTISHSIGVAALDLGAEGMQLLNHAKPSATEYVSLDSLTAEIVSMLREASQSPSCSPIACLKAALDWVRLSKDIDPTSTIEAYTTAFNQMDVILSLGQSLVQRQDRLLSDNLVMEARGLGGEAATWALQLGEPERAVELLERSRTLLLTQVGRYRVELDDLDKVEPSLANRFVELSRLLNASVVSNQHLVEERSTIKDPYGRYRKLSIEWNEVVEKIRAIPNFETFLRPASFLQLRNVAVEGPVIVIIPHQEASDAFIIYKPPLKDPKIHLVRLPLANSERLAELSRKFTQALDPLNDKGNRMEGLCFPHLRSLWKEIVEPIAQALQHDLGIQVGSRVWWCPTSVSCSLPLHAAGMYSKGQDNFPNLYTSSYTPTLQALMRARRLRDARRAMPKKLLVVVQSAGLPDPSQPPAPHRSQPVALDDPLQLGCATREAKTIAETLSPTWKVKTLSNKKGTCKAVQLKMVSHPWVHFICHGNQVEDRPLDSYLSLYDGPLTLHKIIEQELPNADFAFLAACHSAAGDRALANEVLHLAAAMQFAGFRSVIGTLWKMRDEDGPPLAEAFYREMLQYEDGRGAAVALNAAFKNLRRKDSRPRVSINGLMRFVHIGI